MLAEIIPKIAAEIQAARHSYRPRPSMAGPERCIRSMVYDALQIPANPFPGRAVLVFDDSSWHETLTADWLRKSAFRVHSEQMEVETPVGKGHIDWIVTDLLGVDRLVEHKALNHFSFERIWKGQWPLDYLTQLALYLAGLQPVNPEISEGILLVKNKNTAGYIELRCQYDQDTDTLSLIEVIRSDGERSTSDFKMERVCQSAVEKFASVQDYTARNTLPVRPFEYGTDYPCGYCSWGETCWKTYEEEFGALAEDPALGQEFVDAAAYYNQVGAQLSEMEKEKKDIRGRIVSLLLASGKKAGIAKSDEGQYAISLILVDRDGGLDEDLIPPDILAKARKKISYQQLNCRPVKPKKESKK